MDASSMYEQVPPDQLLLAAAVLARSWESRGLLLGMMEASWRQMPGLRARAGFPMFPDTPAFDRGVAQMRYVDDLLSVTTCLCAPCTATLVQRQHPGIPFSCEGTTEGGPVKWLDILVHGCRTPPHVSVCMPELGWVRGELPRPTKFRIKPYLGAAHADGAELKSHVRGRLSRWGQLRLARREVLRALAYECCCLVRSGYPPRLIRETWIGCSRDHTHTHTPRLSDRPSATDRPGVVRPSASMLGRPPVPLYRSVCARCSLIRFQNAK